MDYKGLQKDISDAANTQTNANRPNQNTPWASQSWEQGANGDWTQNTALSGGLGQAANDLQSQVGQAYRAPFDFGQFGQAGTGDDARNQAVNAAYGQATSRLDPQWQQREQQTRSQLLSQGLDPSSEAYRNEMQSLGQQRNDAYGSAMNSAIGQGTAAGDSVFRNNMMARQQAISEALRGRGMPMEDLKGLQSFLSMPGFNQDGTSLQSSMFNTGLAEKEYADKVRRAQEANAADADAAKGGMSAAGSAISAMALTFGSMF